MKKPVIIDQFRYCQYFLRLGMRKSSIEPAEPVSNIQLKNISETKRQQKMALYRNVANIYFWFHSPRYRPEEKSYILI